MRSFALAEKHSRAISHNMSETRLNSALERLERALARVETQTARSVTPNIAAVPSNPETEAALIALGERHDRLKQQVESVIAALDRIIAKG